MIFSDLDYPFPTPKIPCPSYIPTIFIADRSFVRDFKGICRNSQHPSIGNAFIPNWTKLNGSYRLINNQGRIEGEIKDGNEFIG